mgnify:CR=1 FL=1
MAIYIKNDLGGGGKTKTSKKNPSKPKDKEPSAAETMKFSELVEQRRAIQQRKEEAEKVRSMILKAGNDFNTGYSGTTALWVQGYSNNELEALNKYIETLDAMDVICAEEQNRMTGENTFAVKDTKKNTEKVETNYRDTMYCDTGILSGEVIPQYTDIESELKNMYDSLYTMNGINAYEGMEQLQLQGLSQLEAIQASNVKVKEKVGGIVESAERIECENQRQEEILRNKTNEILGIKSIPKEQTTESKVKRNNQILWIKGENIGLGQKLEEQLAEEQAIKEKMKEEQSTEASRAQAAIALRKQNELLGIEQNLTYSEIKILTDNLLGDYLQPGARYDEYAKQLDRIYSRYAYDEDYENLERGINNLLDKLIDEEAENQKDNSQSSKKEIIEPSADEESLDPIYKDIIKLNDKELMLVYIDTHKCTPESLIVAAHYVHDNQRDWGYSITGGLPETNFEDVLNNPKQLTCCATYVASVLYVSGYIKEEDIVVRYNGKDVFNPHLPGNIDSVLEERGWIKIEDPNELQAGDIVFYDKQGTDEPDHVDIWVGKDEKTGITMKYSAGGEREIQSVGPFKKEEPNWDSKVTWWAYRPANESAKIEDDNENSSKEEQE